jgi:prepilin-type N-terminal cleavage/methylation domain-containing protein
VEREPVNTAIQRLRTRAERRDNRGFTLIEVAIAIVLLGAITAVIVSSFLTSLSSARITAQRARESNDAQLISAFLVRDAQSAGGSDPLTGKVDGTIGVEVTTGGTNANGTGGCYQPSLDANIAASFRWYDRVPGGANPIARVANYYRNPPQHELVRVTCSGSDFQTGNMTTDGSVVMGRNVASATAACLPATACPPAAGQAPPNFVTLQVTETNSPASAPVGSPYTFTLTAAVRAESQVTPVLTNSTPVALMSLNNSAASCAMGGANATNGIRIAGTSVKVSGAVVVDTPDAAACPGMRVVTGTVYNATATSIVTGGSCTNCTTTPLPDVLPSAWPDPYLPNAATGYPGLPNPALASQCATANTNPTRATRTITATTTNASPNVVVTVGAMTATDVGATITGTGIAANSSILAVIDATHFTLSVNATASGSSVKTIVDPWPATTDATTVYGAPGGLTLNLAEALASGTPGTPAIFILCHGIKIIGLSDDTSAPVPVVVRNAMLYLAGAYPGCPLAGSICYYNAANTAATIANFNLQSPTSGPYQNIGIWQPASNAANLSIPGGDDQTNAVVGVVYAPAASVNLDNGDGDLAADTAAHLVDPIGLTIGGIVAKAISINSGQVAVGPFTIVTPSLPAAKLNVAYPATTLTAAGGTLPYNTWTATGLPAGMSINASTGVISGTPTSGACTAPFVHVTVSDSSTPAQTTFHDYVLSIGPANMSITTVSPLLSGEVGAPYAAPALTASGGCAPYTWSATGLPPGLSVNPATGIISGTPTATVNNASVIVTATDTNSPTTVVTKALTITIKAGLAITTASLPNGVSGTPYPLTTMAATGGQTPYSWSITAGTPPTGLTMTAAGVWSGTPSAVGTFSFTVGVSDALGGSATRAYSVTITPAPMVISPATLPSGKVNSPYSTTLSVSGGVGPYTWSISAGALPPGLSLAPATGVISGTPTAAGSFGFTVQVTDSLAATATKPYTLQIKNRATDVTLANSTGTAGKADGGDTVAIKFSSALSVASMCSTWSNDLANQTLAANNDVTVSIVDNGTNDTLTVSSLTCSFNFGSVALGGDYVTAGNNRTFNGANASRSTITWNATTFTLTIRLGTANLATISGIPLGTPTYTPSGSINDATGQAIDTGSVSGSAPSRF